MQKKKLNLFDKKEKAQRNKKIKKVLIIAGICLGIIIIFFGTLYLIYQKPAKTVYEKSISGKDNFFIAQDYLLAQDFQQAKTSLDSAIYDLQTADTEFNKLNWLQVIPGLGTQIKALDNLLTAGVDTGNSIKVINNIALELITPLQEEDDISLNSLSDEQTENLLKGIYETKGDLENSKQSIDTAVEYINKIPEKGLITQIREVVSPFRERAYELQIAIDQAISASQILPSVAGYPEQKTYLFLLQNNTEMRPTGGFIGTYGILKIKNGDIDEFITDNSYNLDKPAEEYLYETPPWPLTRYNNVHRWFFRDSNWSPDFPTASKKVEEFYHLEKGPEKNIDGIIAVTPTFIESLLTLTGSIKVDGLEFTQENLTETLQYQVEQGYLRQGLEESERKEIIGDLSKKILDGVLDLPKSKWPDLWQVFSDDIKEKQILINIKDNYVQNYIIKENWGGDIKSNEGDYFTVIDANLASLKTDPAVKRTISYNLTRENENIIANLSIAYNNHGEITWKTTRYRTYTRVYVPSGSILINSEGAMIDCKLDDTGSIEIENEFDKTVFGTFICIEPGETGTLSFKYQLPDFVANQYNNGYYSLMIQKQAGAASHELHLNLDFANKPEYVGTLDSFNISKDNEILINTNLNQDQIISINF